MAYNLKGASPLINTKLTDAGRKRISEGTFNISYFQIGDSEVCYDCISNGSNLSTGMVLNPQYNAQNLTPIPQKNQSNIKYPFLINTQSTNTYGIPSADPQIDDVFNSASPLGFFTGNTTYTYSNVSESGFSAFTSSEYTINPNFILSMSGLSSGDTVTLTADIIDASVSGNVSSGYFMTVFYGGSDSSQPVRNDYPILTYMVIDITGDTSGNTGSVTVKVDRNLPDLQSLSWSGDARVIFYPTGMTEIYDTLTPEDYWSGNTLDYEAYCQTAFKYVKVWNMNIPWTESPAGLFNNLNQDFNYFGSTGYTGTKEYLGYNSDTGQTDTDSTYYYNSFADKIVVQPSDQKSIAIVHYSNNSIDNFYAEKFATEDVNTNITLSAQTGQGRKFRVDLPTLMWHKSKTSNIGETFYVDPDGFNGLNLFQPHYIESNVNNDMNNPGMRYYHLWDTHPNSNGIPNRVGKVWPDLKMVTFDDDEIIAALSNKSNRNWTLPAPKLGLVIPNTFNGTSAGETGVLSGSNECMWVTYRFNNTAFTESLHCNYYSKICGNDPDCPPETADVIIRFGNEFPFLSSDGSQSGFSANELVILAQKVTGDTRPDPTQWVEIDVMNQISATTVGGYITASGLTGTTIIINDVAYSNGTQYRLDNHITLPSIGDTGTTFNFGDEYYFYGNITTDIQATIYVMNYKCNLGQTQFLTSQNPTWTSGMAPYVTEVGLYDSNKELMIISKVQSPQKRQGVQQYTIKFDF